MCCPVVGSVRRAAGSRRLMPIVDLDRSIATSFRVRLGKRGENRGLKGYLRATSPSEKVISSIAAIYGRQVKKIDSEYETAIPPELRVGLVQSSETLSQWYEQWGRAGCLRRCDGVGTTDGLSCICKSVDEMVCKPTTRLSFLLLDVPMLAFGRLDTRGMIAAKSLPGIVELMSQVQGGGLIAANLRVVWRDAGSKHYQTVQIDVTEERPILSLEKRPMMELSEGTEDDEYGL